ncbi:MAG: hypothetical protein ACO1NO_06750 [Burkholderiaceae bacterium]|jgi:hypothetical protein
MEFLRLGLVYVHLIACCVAIGLILTSDIAMVKKLFSGEADTHQEREHLSSLKHIVSISLVALWITGAAIIWLDASANGLSYFYNPKIQAKIAVVVLLTLNGFLLHNVILPVMEKAGSLMNMAFRYRFLAIFSGAFSAVSWFYAAMLGVGRPLAWKYSLVELLAAYPAMIIGGTCMMLMLTMWARNKNNSNLNLEFN